MNETRRSWKRGATVTSWGMLLGAMVMTGGCGSKNATAADEPKTSAAAAGKAVEMRETSGGTYYVTYVPSPDPIPLNKVFELDVRVYRDAALTVPASEVEITVDAAMPTHHHGMNLSPRDKRTADGQFHVTGMLFHMPGYWEIYVDVTANARQERARFEVNLK